MIRPLWLEYEGAVYHVTSRGNAREDIFRDDEDLARFLEILGDGLRAGALLEPDGFVKQLRSLLKENPVDPEYRKRERKRERFAARLCLEDLFNDVASKATRNERIHQAVRVHRYTLGEVGGHAGLFYSTIRVIVKRVHKTVKYSPQ